MLNYIVQRHIAEQDVKYLEIYRYDIEENRYNREDRGNLLLNSAKTQKNHLPCLIDQFPYNIFQKLPIKIATFSI